MVADGEDWEAVFSIIKQNGFGVLYAIKFYRDLTRNGLFDAVNFVEDSQVFKDNITIGTNSREKNEDK